MNNADFQLRSNSDPRLAAHAASSLPAWLWSTDGARILWATPAGARLFGATDAASLAAKTFGPADPHRRQVAQLAGRLLPTGATRLERLRGFGAAFGTLATCACSRLDFADGGAGVLVVAMLTAGELQRFSAPERIAPAHREERPSLQQMAGAADSAAPEQRADPAAQEHRADAREATGHLVVEPLPESSVHAEIAPTHQPDAAAMDRST